MVNKNAQIIHRMIQEGEYILKFIDGMTPEQFGDDEKTKRAVTQTLANISELENALDREFKEKYEEAPWAAIRRTRNVIAHDYLSVNFQTIWQTAVESIPEFMALLHNIETTEIEERT
jgi:uncharacterized protein with HEPN domain